MAFGPTNVGFWTVAVCLELDEPELALEAAAVAANLRQLVKD